MNVGCRESAEDGNKEFKQKAANMQYSRYETMIPPKPHDSRGDGEEWENASGGKFDDWYEKRVRVGKRGVQVSEVRGH